MVLIIALLARLAFATDDPNAPAFMNSVCTYVNLDNGRPVNLIEDWTQVPHDLAGIPTADQQGDGNGNFKGKDWWYYKDDWRLKIADGDLEEEEIGNNGNRYCAVTVGETFNFSSQDLCRKSCSNSYTLQVNQAKYERTNSREYCRFFSYDTDTGECRHSYSCNWADDSSVTTRTTYRLVEIYPAGFKSYQLAEFNEPPVCLRVETGGANKKVEVMIESDVKDARICIVDGSDAGVSNNDIGNVKTCDNGQLYSCFTAANRDVASTDFYFYIFCDEACEAADVPIWVRIRVSDNGWDGNKTGVDDDIEMWCENEKEAWITKTVDKNVLINNDANETPKMNLLTGKTQLSSYPDNIEKDGDNYVFQFNDFTWPSELNPEEPAAYPFRVNKGLGSAAPAVHVSRALLVVLLAALGLLM